MTRGTVCTRVVWRSRKAGASASDSGEGSELKRPFRSTWMPGPTVSRTCWSTLAPVSPGRMRKFTTARAWDGAHRPLVLVFSQASVYVLYIGQEPLMPQLNIHLTPEFEAALTEYMRLRRVRTKSDAVRLAIQEAVERERRHRVTPNFARW